MNALKLRIPPPIVALLFGVGMWLAGRAMPGTDFELPGRLVIAGCVAVLGVVSAVGGVVSFRRAKTTLNPMAPEKASSLVTTGIFARTRNPMYLGLLLALTGWAVFLANVIGFVFLPAFILYMNCFQIGPEEMAMRNLFGEDYSAYKSRVRRWL